MDCCGYEGLARLDFLSHTNRFQYLKEQRHSLPVIQIYDTVPPTATPRDEIYSENNNNNNTNDDIKVLPSSASATTNATSILECKNDPNSLSVMVAFICEYLAVTSQFTQFSYDYYRAICVIKDDNNSDNSTNEKACLIPICAIQSNVLFGDHHPNPSTNIASSSSPSSPTLSSSSSNNNTNNNNTTTSSISSVNTISITTSASSPTNNIKDNEGNKNQAEFRQNKKIKLDNYDRLSKNEGLNSNCMEGVDQSLQILSKAGDCLRHLVNLWDWATHTSPGIDWIRLFGDWEKEFKRIIDSYQLPFDIYNAILLVRSELALSTVIIKKREF